MANDTHAGRDWLWLEPAYDALFNERNRKMLKRLVIRLSVFSFVVHLLLIFLAYALHAPQHWIDELGSNYLAAISTPFNFILFYEVLTLIAALPESTTRSIANQFEIVSLIFIRNVFHDIVHANELVAGHRITAECGPLFMDMWAGILMFLLVAVFRHISLRHLSRSRSSHNVFNTYTQRFILQKKAVATGLTVLLIGMALWNVFLFGLTAVHILLGQAGALESATSYYNDLFTVMIFTDVLVLILSLVASDRYELVFRNAAFVVSIVLIRFALTAGFPFGAPLALTAMALGVCTVLIYNYHVYNRYRTAQ
ncbi:hypothetical protein ACOBR2_00380 [Telmatobacter bradus]|uniref:hypothetical protein n=1 Tax=Telmatobacter bradus TaxID=474953 RepID=UPI003B42E195